MRVYVIFKTYQGKSGRELYWILKTKLKQFGSKFLFELPRTRKEMGKKRKGKKKEKMMDITVEETEVPVRNLINGAS